MITDATSSAAVFAMWRRGELSAREALTVLCDDLALLDATLTTVATQRDALCDQIGQIVAHSGTVAPASAGPRPAYGPVDQLLSTLIAAFAQFAIQRAEQRSAETSTNR